MEDQNRNKRKSHKILVLENSLNVGGAERLLYDILSRIDKERFDVVICCLKDGGYFKDDFKALGFTFYDKILTYKYDFWAYRRLARIIVDEKVDLIYSHINRNTVLFSHLSMLTRSVKAWIVAVHSSGSTTGGRLIGPLHKRLLSRVSRFIAIADMHKKYLVEVEGLPAEKTDVIHNGIDIEKHSPGPTDPSLRSELGLREGEVVLTTIASLNPRKRHDILLRAGASVLERHPRLRFLVVGDGPERSRLEGIARDLGIGDRVIFTGIRDDVNAILRLSDLFVLSSMLGTETFPIVLLEAMAAGVPVVSTDVGSVRELVSDGRSATVVPPENPDALAQAIDALLIDEDKARGFGKAGRQIVEERFRLELTVKKTEALLEYVLDAAS
jgi:glycosyltransferase involved in cell wall biosynthesis